MKIVLLMIISSSLLAAVPEEGIKKVLMKDVSTEFDQLDQNHDGALVPSESQTNKELGQRFKLFDSNKNEQLDKIEFVRFKLNVIVK